MSNKRRIKNSNSSNIDDSSVRPAPPADPLMIIPEEHLNKSDEELVFLALKNEDYYLVLMKRYEARLLRYIRRISNSSEDEAEDVLQDVFIKVYENLYEFDRRLKFSSWIYRITHNQVISDFRKRKARPNVLHSVDDKVIINKLVAEMDVEANLDKGYLSSEVAELLSYLDKKYCDVLVLRYLEDKNYDEISDILKVPVGTVGTLLNRARKKIKVEMTKKRRSEGRGEEFIGGKAI